MNNLGLHIFQAGYGWFLNVFDAPPLSLYPIAAEQPVVIDQGSVLPLGHDLRMRQCPPGLLLAEVQKLHDLRFESIASGEPKLQTRGIMMIWQNHTKSCGNLFGSDGTEISLETTEDSFLHKDAQSRLP